MSNLVIVAIPEQDDYVWKISSEKVPHMTICYLGDPTQTPNVVKMAEFLEHAADTMLTPFWLDVSERGTLGPDNADVVFFEGAWDLPEIKRFRAMLLQNEDIRKAYDSADQHPDWLPHLTLGYPAAPAKPDNRDYPGVRSVRFDKVALWIGNFEGPEFKLKTDFEKYPMEVAMSGTTDKGLLAVSEVLQHHGVKGMRWGVRRSRSGPTESTVRQKGKKLKTEGGKGHGPHPDAIAAAKISQKRSASGAHSLSNEELRQLGERMQLEQKVSQLHTNQRSGGKQFVKNLLKNVGTQQAHRVANEVATKQVDKHLLKKKDQKN